MTVPNCIIFVVELGNVSKSEMRNAGQQEYVIIIKGKGHNTTVITLEKTRNFVIKT